jgi:hypothetical protein
VNGTNGDKDPTPNVQDLVEAAILRQDDLRTLESGHIREVAALRAHYDEKLREAETARINAIRAVDVGAAATLAQQVAASAEALRGQVEAARIQTAATLAAALEPIQKDIQDLRKTQYESQGQRAQVIETRDVRGESRLNQGQLITFLLLITAVLSLVLLYATKK